MDTGIVRGATEGTQRVILNVKESLHGQVAKVYGNTLNFLLRLSFMYVLLKCNKEYQGTVISLILFINGG